MGLWSVKKRWTVHEESALCASAAPQVQIIIIPTYAKVKTTQELAGEDF
jgi:hypothetical protein